MKINPVRNKYVTFSSASTQVQKNAPSTSCADNDKNPIKKSLEQLDAIRATITAGISAGVYALYYLNKEGFAFDTIFDTGLKIAQKNESKTKKALIPLMYLGSVALVFAGFVAVIAAAYTAFNAPKALYKGKVDAFKKEKEMDLYIKGNKVEKELYNQMNEAAKNANPEEKKQLAIQYAKLKAAKNVVPDFVDMH